MANNCVSGLNTTRTSQISPGNIGIISARVDENGRLILTRTDGTTITANTSDCCCCTLASKNYALRTIQENTASFGNITINTSNNRLSGGKLQTTPITPAATTVDLLFPHGGLTYTIAVRDIESITFTTAPVGDVLDSLSCDSSISAPQCNTNIALETKLRKILADSADPVAFPVEIVGNLGFSTNLIDSSYIKTIYGICNGILWASTSTNGTDTIFQAIPLCNIQYISFIPTIGS